MMAGSPRGANLRVLTAPRSSWPAHVPGTSPIGANVGAQFLAQSEFLMLDRPLAQDPIPDAEPSLAQDRLLSSWPGLSRPSTASPEQRRIQDDTGVQRTIAPVSQYVDPATHGKMFRGRGEKGVDGRDEPGHDERRRFCVGSPFCARKLAPVATSPAMTLDGWAGARKNT